MTESTFPSSQSLLPMRRYIAPEGDPLGKITARIALYGAIRLPRRKRVELDGTRDHSDLDRHLCWGEVSRELAASYATQNARRGIHHGA